MIQLYFLFQVAGQLSQHHLLINPAFIPLLKMTSLSGLDIINIPLSNIGLPTISWDLGPFTHLTGSLVDCSLQVRYWRIRKSSRGMGLEPPEDRVGMAEGECSKALAPMRNAPGLWADSCHALSWMNLTPSWCPPRVVVVQLSHRSAEQGEEKCFLTGVYAVCLSLLVNNSILFSYQTLWRTHRQKQRL